MKNILVPIGSVENGINNLRYAVNFANITQARVYVTCIKTGDNTEAILKEVLDNVHAQHIQVVSKFISGDIFEGIASFAKALHIDFIILSPQSIELNSSIYLGKVTGKIVRETNIPMLIVPRDYLFRRFDNILMAFKNANFKNEDNLETIEEIKDIFNAQLHLLHVKTPDAPEEASIVSERLLANKDSLTNTNNATVFQGVLENYQAINPDMICLLRRKKQNMFEKFWQRNEILKEEFHSSKPLLILRERE